MKTYCPTRTRLFPKRPKTQTPTTHRLPGPNNLRRRPSQLPPPAQARTTPRGWGGSRGEHRRTAPAAAGGAPRGRPRNAPPLWFAPLPGQRIQRARRAAALGGRSEWMWRGCEGRRGPGTKKVFKDAKDSCFLSHSL